METIEQLHSDPRPLVSLANVSAVTGESLGELLLRLAGNDIPLFVERPEEARIFCVTQSLPMPHREATYPEAILSPSRGLNPPGFMTPKRGETHIDASHFNYLVLTSADYAPLTEGGSRLSVKLFRQTAYIDKGGDEPITVNASDYYREHLPKASPLEKMKAQFSCCYQNKEWPSTFKFTSVTINSEELLVSRTSLLDRVLSYSKQSTCLLPELQCHLQPWKSDLLLALNKAAFKVHSNDNENKIFSKEQVMAAINEQINGSRPSDTTLSRLATLLRHDRQPANYRKAVNSNSTNKYPPHFTPQLIYLNEKSEKYYTDYQGSKNQTLPSAKAVQLELQEDGVISKDTAIRVASALIPRLRHSTL